jgi:hypothetical protein
MKKYTMTLGILLGLSLAWTLTQITGAAAIDGPLLTILNHTDVDFARRNMGTAELAETVTGWDPNVVPMAPFGYLGDPTVTHKVIGSRLSTNFFRVEGPNAGGPGVNSIQTDLFVIQGKLH